MVLASPPPTQILATHEITITLTPSTFQTSTTTQSSPTTQSPTTTFTAPNNAQKSAVIVSSTLAGLFFLVSLVFLLAWYRLWIERKLLMASGTYIPELPMNQTGSLRPRGDTFNDQSHELPAQQMAHAQELPPDRSNSFHELPLNTKSSAREV